MSPTRTFHIELEKESDASFRFHYVDKSTGLPTDLTDYRAEMHVRQNYEGSNQPDTVLSFTSEENGGLVLGGPQGFVDVFISFEDTSTINWDKGIYTLFLINPRGGRIPLVKGFFTVLPNAFKLSNTALTDISSSKPEPWNQPNNLNVGGLNKDNPESQS